MIEISSGKWGYFDQIIFNANKTGQRLSLDINTSTKYLYVSKNQVVQMSWKPGCAGVLYNHIVDKDFRLCRCRILNSNITDLVKVRLCECSVQWYLRKDFRLCRCKPLKSFSENLKKSGWMSVALYNFVSTDFRLYRYSVAHVKFCWWSTNSCRLCWCYLEIYKVCFWFQVVKV